MRSLSLSASCLFALLIGLPACTPTEPVDAPAEVIFENGNFITLDPATPQAAAIAVRGERILSVGSREEIEKYRGEETEVIDLEGLTVVPGLIDAHEHFPDIGKRVQQVFLDETKSAAEALEIVKRELEKIPPGDWLVGQGWHTVSWNGSDYPGQEELSRISPDNPVYLVGMASHAAWVNARALKLAGIGKDTPDPPGGKILKREDTGEPTGILLEEALDLVSRLLPPVTRESRKEDIRRSIETALRFGLTGMHDAGSNAETVEIFKELVAEDAFPFRLYVMLDVPDAGAVLDSYLEHPPEVGLGDHRLTIRCFKAYADGALGARGAALLEPYSDDAEATGLIQNSEDELTQLIAKAGRAGYQVAIHAIGDRGNRNTLNAVERAQKELPGKDLRVRIEHAQILSPSDIPRFAGLSVIASMQPIHATMDLGFAETRVGPERIKGRLRLAEPAIFGGARRRRLGHAVLSRRLQQPALGHPRRRHPAGLRGKARGRLVREPESQPYGRAQDVHAPPRVRGVRGGHQGLALARKARRPDGALEGHSHHPRGGDSGHRSRDDRPRWESGLSKACTSQVRRIE